MPRCRESSVLDLELAEADEAEEAWRAEKSLRHRTTHSGPSGYCEAARYAKQRSVRLAHDAVAVVAAVVGMSELLLEAAQEA